jgi:pyruvate/2-oxoglutarate dehydrogenase complex dihydrolipoamide dehydrogenase (E3) component
MYRLRRVALEVTHGHRDQPSPAPVDYLGARDGIHLVHSMGDTFALMDSLARDQVTRAVIVGGGYIGREMAEALTARDLSVTQVEQLPEVLRTVDPDLRAVIHAELERHGVTVACGTRVEAIEVAPPGSHGRLDVLASGPAGDPLRFPADVVLIVVGVRPDSDLAASAGAQLGVNRRSTSISACAPTFRMCSRRTTAP